MKELLKYIECNKYDNYIYSYPHKKAYRDFHEPINLKDLWKNRKSKGLTFYIHIPFCMNKCGYCNLLSTTNFNECKLDKYVDKLIEEMKGVKDFLQLGDYENPFSSVIFGGGTPTILSDNKLKELLNAMDDILNIDFKKVFFSIETSPRTMTKEKMNILKDYNINRISMGIQSFKGSELNKIYRFEPVNETLKALEVLFEENIEIRNLDLIYGIPSQTIESFRESLNKVISYKPEEIFIYPMYIREKTGLYNKLTRDEELMEKMYEMGRNILIKKGYIQTSMRNFIRKDMRGKLFSEYSCQQNEMIGIGCGARSYISNIHYSRKYAVHPKNINKIIDEYLNEEDFNNIKYGYILNRDEEKRRYILKSILKVTGLDTEDYNKKFNSWSLDDYDELNFLLDNLFLVKENNRLYPTEKGLKYSDAIGTLFISKEVYEKMDGFKE